jgi:hypothetical protein
MSSAQSVESKQSIRCNLENNVEFSIVKVEGGYNFEMSRLLAYEYRPEFSLLKSFGVSEKTREALKTGFKLGAFIPHSRFCDFSAEEKDPFFYCSFENHRVPVSLKILNYENVEVAHVDLGQLVIDQHSSSVNALRRTSEGELQKVSWKSYPVLVYFVKKDKEGGPSLGHSWQNQGFRSDNQSHGRCVFL